MINFLETLNFRAKYFEREKSMDKFINIPVKKISGAIYLRNIQLNRIVIAVMKAFRLNKASGTMILKTTQMSMIVTNVPTNVQLRQS